MSEIVKEIVKAVFGFISGLPPFLRVAVLVVIVVALGFAGRCGLLGGAPYNMLWTVWPQETVLDCPRPSLTVSLKLEVLSDGKYIPAWQDRSYDPGTQMRITASASQRCWLAVFSLDSVAFFRLHPQGDEAARYDPDEPLVPIEFVLNSTKGAEIYAVIASRTPILLEEVESAVLTQVPDLSRGPDTARPFTFFDGQVYDAVRFLNSGGG